MLSARHVIGKAEVRVFGQKGLIIGNSTSLSGVI